MSLCDLAGSGSGVADAFQRSTRSSSGLTATHSSLVLLYPLLLMMEAVLDSQLLQLDDAQRSEDDLFGEELKPKFGRGQVKAEVAEHDEEMEDLFGDEEAPLEPPKEKYA